MTTTNSHAELMMTVTTQERTMAITPDMLIHTLNCLIHNQKPKNQQDITVKQPVAA